MKLGLGAAVPSISFIFLWQGVLAWIQILKSWGRSADALRDIEEKLFLLLWSCISPVHINTDFSAGRNSVAIFKNLKSNCVCVLCEAQKCHSSELPTHTAGSECHPSQGFQRWGSLLSESHRAASHARLLAAAASALYSLISFSIN